MAQVIGLVMARRGSGKNMRTIAGEPLVTWAVRVAQRAETLDRIVVSSDDDGILQLARSLGAVPLRRPKELAQDTTPDQPVVDHALTELNLIWGHDDLVVLLRPTAPFRRAREVDDVVTRLRHWQEVSSIRSVVPSPAHPRKLYVDVGFRHLPYVALRPYTAQHAANGPRQALEPVYKPVGFIDAVRANWVLVGSLEGPVIAAWEAPAERAIDLDTDGDFARAEALARARGWRPGGDLA